MTLLGGEPQLCIVFRATQQTPHWDSEQLLFWSKESVRGEYTCINGLGGLCATHTFVKSNILHVSLSLWQLRSYLQIMWSANCSVMINWQQHLLQCLLCTLTWLSHALSQQCFVNLDSHTTWKLPWSCFLLSHPIKYIQTQPSCVLPAAWKDFFLILACDWSVMWSGHLGQWQHSD